MDIASILKVFRLIAAEFIAITDDVVQQWIVLTLPLVNRRKFSKLYFQAVALYTAHRMKMANVGVAQGADPVEEVGDIGVGNLMRIANYSEGETSIGFNTNISQYTDTDAELALTQYGIQYLSLRRMKVIPIISAGER